MKFLIFAFLLAFAVAAFAWERKFNMTQTFLNEFHFNSFQIKIQFFFLKDRIALQMNSARLSALEMNSIIIKMVFVIQWVMFAYAIKKCNFSAMSK